MREKIEQLKKDKEKLTLELKEWVKDKSIPLDERWKVFFDSDLGKHLTSYEDFVNFSTDDYCDNISRHEVVNLDSVSDWVVSLQSDEDYDAFREDVLNEFIKSFEFDW